MCTQPQKASHRRFLLTVWSVISKQDYSKVVEFSEANKSTLPLANSAVRLMLTAPVTVASNERSFSKLKFVLFFTFDIKYYQLSVLYIQETTMNSHKVEINKSFALWKKSRHIKLFLLGNFGLQHPPSPHPFATALDTIAIVVILLSI